MQKPDRFEARRIGVPRVRRVTAAVAVAAAAGTGILTWTLADQAAAAQSPPVVTGPQQDDGGSTSGFLNGNDISPPAQLPGFGGSGPVHASSGGS